MEPINIHVKLDDEAKKEKEQWLKQLSQEPLIQEFLIKNRCEQQLIHKTSMFHHWFNRKKLCEKCKGLSECKQPMKGKVLELVYDGVLNEQFVSCTYLKDKQKQEAYLKNYKIHHLSDEQLRLNFRQIDSSSESNEALEVIRILMKSIDNNQGIYLYGKPGVGKTYLMCCLANAYANQGKTISFVNSAQLISELKMGFNDSGMNDYRLNQLKKVDVLIIDDIGGENVTAWSRDEVLMPLLNERMEKQACTCFTSNYSWEELEEHFAIDSRGNKDVIKANRLMERIKALSAQTILKGKNRRLKMGSQ